MSDKRGGYTRIVKVTPVISTSLYTAGDLMGGKLEFANASRGRLRNEPNSGVIQTVVISDLAQEDSGIDLVLFDSDPTGTTFTDNAAFDVADADLTKIIGVVSLASSDYFDFVDSAVAQELAVSIPFDLPGVAKTSLFGAAVARGTPTYNTASDLNIRVGIFQD